jgi:hypothetical protein
MPTSPLESLTFEELAQARRLARDLANTGVCEPHELRHIWTLCDRIDAAVTAKRQQTPEIRIVP